MLNHWKRVFLWAPTHGEMSEMSLLRLSVAPCLPILTPLFGRSSCLEPPSIGQAKLRAGDLRDFYKLSATKPIQPFPPCSPSSCCLCSGSGNVSVPLHPAPGTKHPGSKTGPFWNPNGHLAHHFQSLPLQNKGLLGIIKQQSCEGTFSLNRNQGHSQKRKNNGKELLSLKY